MKLALFLVVTLPLYSQFQDPSAPFAGSDSARIEITPEVSGDVSIDIYGSTLSSEAVGQIARAIMRCNWQEFETDDQYVSGICRKWLQADATSMAGVVDVAPLVLALRAGGASVVRTRLWTSTASPEAAPQGWRKQTYVAKSLFRARREYFSYTSSSPSFSDMPPPFPVTAGEKWDGKRLVAPLIFLISGPPFLALWLRRRAQRAGTINSAAVWLSWILNGALLYWLSAMRPTDMVGFLASLHLHDVVKLLLGVALYAAPPLAAMASCLLILDPGGADGSDAHRRLIAMALLQQAAFIVPLGVFLSGTSAFGQNSALSIACIPGAYVLYRVISWYCARLRFGGLQNLANGELTLRAAAIAQAAGAKLRGVYILRNRLAREVNAFATGAGIIILTQGLVERFSRRELDAVIAHEAGHLRGRHNGIQSALFWVYILFAGPAIALISSLTGLPAWFASAPILPIVYVLIVARVSQRHEFDADARAAQITGDPEATIAALSRLSKITNSPVDWGGVQGSILTHPSMRSRVLSIARRFNIPAERALQILDNPDLIGAPTPATALESVAEPAVEDHTVAYSLPEEFQQASPVFNSAAMQSYIFWVSWALNVVLVGLLASLAILIGHFLGTGTAVLVFLGSIPAVAWAYLRTANLADELFRKTLRRRIAARVPHPDGAIFVGILPGPAVRPVEGFCEWDMGFLSLTPDWLTYRGERARFSLPRASVSAISVSPGPLSWDRTWGVVVSHDSGAFVLRRPDAGYTRRKARQLEAKLNAWHCGEPTAHAAPQGAEFLSPPDLPLLTPYAPMRWKLATAHMRRAGMLFIGTLILFSALDRVVRSEHLAALVPLAAPLTYLIAVVPTWLRREQT